MRSILKVQTGCTCLIFFDEIDAIVPMRGTGFGGDSHVTERLISQILTDLDGFEFTCTLVL